MEPRIQYCKTSDGVSIAYTTMGAGKPVLVAFPPPWSGVQGVEMYRYFWGQLVESYRVLYFDWRGCGFSDRSALDFSLQAVVRDLEAVAAEAGGAPFTLVAFTNSAPVTVAFAESHPAQVSHLVLCDGWTKFSDIAHSAAHEVEVSLRDKDWELLTETFAQVLWRYEDPALAGQFAELIRASCSPEAWRACWAALASYDASPLMARVTAPTLVVHSRNNRWVPIQVSQAIAAGIRGARLTLMDDLTYASVPALIRDFVGEPATLGRPEPAVPQGTAIILFADIADSTALTERLGDAAFREKARDLDGALRALIRECAGTPVEGPTLGDGVLAVFTSAREAIEAALTCGRAGNDAGLPLHLGLHAGDVTRETDPDGRSNVYGGAVNIASRVAGEAAPGETLVSGTVRDLARTSAGVTFEDRGERSLKGVSEPVRVWAVREA